MKDLPKLAPSDFLLTCVEGSNDAVMLTDADGTIFYVNPAWEKTFGYKSSEVIGENPRILRSGHHPPEFYSAMWKDVLSPEKGYWKGEIINRRKDGKDVPVLLMISHHRSNEGALKGYMSIAVDISEKKKIEAQIQWQDRLATIGVLTAGLAHELGTPLGVARGRAEFLLNSSKSGSVERSSLETIISQIDRVSTFMQSLSNLSKLSPSEMRMPVSLKAVAEDATKLLSARLESSGISLEMNISPLAKVLAEPGRLHYVILNLCLNSIQAIETLKLKNKAEKHTISFRASEQGRSWEFLVQDTGGGFSPDHLPHLFQPFFTTKETGVGTGLGLSMIYQIIQSWNGAMSLDNSLGHGATFRILLPKAE